MNKKLKDYEDLICELAEANYNLSMALAGHKTKSSISHLFGVPLVEIREMILNSRKLEKDSHMGCNVLFDFHSPHNNEYWFKCTTCGATDWFSHYDQNNVEEDRPIRGCKFNKTPDWKDINFKRGKFYIDRKLMISNYKTVMDILSTTLIILAENDFMTDKIIYWGHSEHFDTINDLDNIPEYEAVVKKNLNGTNEISWKRVAKNEL
jgi:hypothetical protein